MQKNIRVVQEGERWYVYQGTIKCQLLANGTPRQVVAERLAASMRQQQYRLVRSGQTVSAQALLHEGWIECPLPTSNGVSDARWSGPRALESGKAYFAKHCIDEYEIV